MVWPTPAVRLIPVAPLIHAAPVIPEVLQASAALALVVRQGWEAGRRVLLV